MSENYAVPPTMKAVYLGKPGGNLIVGEVNTPVCGKGEVLVKMKAAPINYSDLARVKKANALNDPSFLIPGIEGSGIVVSAGKGLLPHLWMGKRVSCSSEYPGSGTWAEYMLTKAGKCFPLNNKIDYEQGSMSLVNPLTALGFFEIANKGGHKAIINNAGASALGRMVEFIGNRNRIPVINLVRSQQLEEKLRNSGSKFVLNTSSCSFIDDLGKLSHQLEATLLFDSVCSPQLVKMIEVLPARSSVIIYGNLSGEEHIMVNPRSLIDKEIRISGFFLGNWTKENSIFSNILNLRKVRNMMLSNMKIGIQGRFPLERIQEAIDTYMANMSAGKVLLVND